VAHNHHVVFALFADAQSLDLAGPLEVFDVATRLSSDRSVAYRTSFASVDGGLVSLSSGLCVVTQTLSSIRNVDTLIVVGGLGTDKALQNERLLLALRRLAGRAARVASVCTGSFLLGELGMLDGLRATTHWRWAATFAERYPAIDVDPSAIFVQSGHVWTSAGVTSGIDLALALVADDHGTKTATAVARHLVVYLQRPGGQSQFTDVEVASGAIAPQWADLLEWTRSHLRSDLSVGALAGRMNLSDRQFARLFAEKVGTTPGAYVEALRVRAACDLLENSANTTSVIATQCGFGTIETMHRSFRRQLNTTPSAHRKHFAA
jgi:transcriptional regulator GlxA family with amidase domain